MLPLTIPESAPLNVCLIYTANIMPFIRKKIADAGSYGAMLSELSKIKNNLLSFVTTSTEMDSVLQNYIHQITCLIDYLNLSDANNLPFTEESTKVKTDIYASVSKTLQDNEKNNLPTTSLDEIRTHILDIQQPLHVTLINQCLFRECKEALQNKISRSHLTHCSQAWDRLEQAAIHRKKERIAHQSSELEKSTIEKEDISNFFDKAELESLLADFVSQTKNILQSDQNEFLKIHAKALFIHLKMKAQHLTSVRKLSQGSLTEAEIIQTRGLYTEFTDLSNGLTALFREHLSIQELCSFEVLIVNAFYEGIQYYKACLTQCAKQSTPSFVCLEYPGEMYSALSNSRNAAERVIDNYIRQGNSFDTSDDLYTKVSFIMYQFMLAYTNYELIYFDTNSMDANNRYMCFTKYVNTLIKLEDKISNELKQLTENIFTIVHKLANTARTNLPPFAKFNMLAVRYFHALEARNNADIIKYGTEYIHSYVTLSTKEREGLATPNMICKQMADRLLNTNKPEDVDTAIENYQHVIGIGYANETTFIELINILTKKHATTSMPYVSMIQHQINRYKEELAQFRRMHTPPRSNACHSQGIELLAVAATLPTISNHHARLLSASPPVSIADNNPSKRQRHSDDHQEVRPEVLSASLRMTVDRALR